MAPSPHVCSLRKSALYSLDAVKLFGNDVAQTGRSSLNVFLTYMSIDVEIAKHVKSGMLTHIEPTFAGDRCAREVFAAQAVMKVLNNDASLPKRLFKIYSNVILSHFFNGTLSSNDSPPKILFLNSCLRHVFDGACAGGSKASPCITPCV